MTILEAFTALSHSFAIILFAVSVYVYHFDNDKYATFSSKEHRQIYTALGIALTLSVVLGLSGGWSDMLKPTVETYEIKLIDIQIEKE